MSKPKNRSGMVYSTNPEFQFEDLGPGESELLPWPSQKLKVSLDKSGRAGKAVSLVDGFAGPADELERLAKELKNLCGTGGSAKDGQVLIREISGRKLLLFSKRRELK